jgi:pimeloyl-ACP methyl ester carboxylesterase
MTTWVLLRGLTREARHWARCRSISRPGSATHRSSRSKLPGYGARHRERSPETVADMVAACRTSLAEAGAVPPYDLMGLSLGAMVATAWTCSQPGELAGVVLINASSRALSPWYRRLRWRAIPSVVRIFATRDAVARRHR